MLVQFELNLTLYIITDKIISTNTNEAASANIRTIAMNCIQIIS